MEQENQNPQIQKRRSFDHKKDWAWIDVKDGTLIGGFGEDHSLFPESLLEYICFLVWEPVCAKLPNYFDPFN